MSIFAKYMITSFQMENYQFVVIGGGISGVTCVESVSL
jgi:glycerol-3-phosphate dehydrogenase